jgi:hypothetical protein
MAASAPQPPAQVTCIYLPAALSGIEVKGLFKVESKTRLERGPYIAELEDADGTYFRAPPGGVYLGPPKNKPAKGAWQLNRDGGIFVPRDPAAPPQLYSHGGDIGTSAATVVPPATADCATTSYQRDPATKAVRAAGYPGEGATSTAAVQVGQGAAANMTGFLGSYLRDIEVGKIFKLPLTKNDEFNAKLKELTRTVVPAKESPATN